MILPMTIKREWLPKRLSNGTLPLTNGCPYFKIDYTYSSNEITLVYARWNDSHRAYDASVEKSVYELNDANMPVAYMNYKWNDKWIEESSVNWAMNVATPATNEATLLTASR